MLGMAFAVDGGIDVKGERGGDGTWLEIGSGRGGNGGGGHASLPIGMHSQFFGEMQFAQFVAGLASPMMPSPTLPFTAA